MATLSHNQPPKTAEMKKVFLFIAIAFSLTSQAQKINGQIMLQKGQKFEVVTETKANSTQEAMGQTIESSSTTTITQIYDVQEAGKNGAAIEQKVKRFQLNGEGGMGQSMSFDSEKPEDRKNEIGQILDKKVLKNKYTMMIDAFGRVVGVKADDDNPNGKKEEDGGMASMLLQQLGTSSELPKAGDKTIFSILPNREVGVGDTWSDSSKIDGAAVKKIFKLVGITADAITVEYTTATSIEKTMNVMGQDAAIKGKENGLGTMTIDRKTGLLKTITASSKNEATVEVQGMTIPVNGTTNTTITVKAL
jgi:hypothetical protein